MSGSALPRNYWPEEEGPDIETLRRMTAEGRACNECGAVLAKAHPKAIAQGYTVVCRECGNEALRAAGLFVAGRDANSEAWAERARQRRQSETE